MSLLLCHVLREAGNHPVPFPKYHKPRSVVSLALANERNKIQVFPHLIQHICDHVDHTRIPRAIPMLTDNKYWFLSQQACVRVETRWGTGHQETGRNPAWEVKGNPGANPSGIRGLHFLCRALSSKPYWPLFETTHGQKALFTALPRQRH